MSKRRFDESAFREYRLNATGNDAGIFTKELIFELVEDHRANQKPRLEELEDYYKGNNKSILEERRRKDKDKADNRVSHSIADYVSTFIQGFMVGSPIKTSHKDEDIDEFIKDLNRLNDADEVNSSLVLSQSIYGRAYQLLYRNEEHETRFVELDPKNTFVVYDTTVEKKRLGAINYRDGSFGEEDKQSVTLYLKDEVIEYELSGSDLFEVAREPHFFGDVPVVEIFNNKFRLGDFERVLSLIDAYDASQSDIANYSQDLNDALLKIVGVKGFEEEQFKNMKEHNVLLVIPDVDVDGKAMHADAGYIYKEYDVSGAEAYKDRLFSDALLFSSVPNLHDDSFSGTQSGEALKLKLIGLEQKRATKERLLIKALRERYNLINNISQVVKEASFDVSDIDITFTENIPRNISSDIEWFTKLGGRLSEETKLKLAPFVDNAQEELERIKEEEEKEVDERSNYGFPVNRVINESDDDLTADEILDEINSDEEVEVNE